MSRFVTALGLAAVLFAPVAAEAQTVTLSPLWQMSDATTPSTKPSYFGANTERGFAAGTLGGVATAVVVSRNTGLFFRQHDPLTGSLVASHTGTGAGQTFDNTVVTGGTFAVNDAEFGGEALLACNLTLNVATTPFKCYRWTNLAAAPTRVIELTDATAPANGARVGDTFTLVTEGAGLALYASTSGSAVDRVYKWTSSDAGVSWSAAPIMLKTSPTTVSVPSVAPVGDGTFFLKGAGIGAMHYAADGTLLGTVSTNSIPTGATVTRHFTSGGASFLATLVYAASNGATPPVFTGQRVNVYRLDPTRPDTAYAAGSFSLGNTANVNGTGDVAILTLGAQLAIGGMASNNGIAVFTGVVTTAAGRADEPVGLSVAVWGRRVRVTADAGQAVTVEAFDVLGRRVATLASGQMGTGEVREASLDGLAAGVYVVRASGRTGVASAPVVVR